LRLARFSCAEKQFSPRVQIGIIYAFFDGLIGGAVFAWLYNRLVKSGS